MVFFFDNDSKPGGNKSRPAFQQPSDKTEALLRARGKWDDKTVEWETGNVTEPRLTEAELRALAQKHRSHYFNRDRAFEVKKRMKSGKSLPQIKSELARFRRHGYGARQIEKDHAALLPHITG